MTTVPLVDLGWQQREVAAEVAEGFAQVLAATDFVGGGAVHRFEEAYAAYTGVAHCIGVGNGTDALEIALRASGIGADDEVIVPANTFVATAEAVVRAGARPVFVDVKADTLLLDSEAVAAAVGPRTRAVIPVHLFGQAAPVEQLADLVARHDLVVIEDAAQSQGATRLGRPAGSLGQVAGTSFYPGKNLGAYGDAGAVLTDDEGVAHRARLLANHGSDRKYIHESFGFNSRLDTLQAVVLSAKLARLDGWNELRRAAAAIYAELLADLEPVVLPTVASSSVPVWHLYVVRVPRRDEVLHRLQEAGVGAGIHYPVAVHLQPAFAGYGKGAGSAPVAERAAEQILSLPLYPGITPEQQDRVATALREALQ
ncbi:MAG TPA: DegT/DnrJ/EryC1/StrS family aminotransferase [Actinomycetes bacterium]